MSVYCERQGHDFGSGQSCLNCGEPKPNEHGPKLDTSSMLGCICSSFSDPNPNCHVCFPGLHQRVLDANGNVTDKKTAIAEGSKPTNPKDAIAVSKLPISWVPTAVVRYAALAAAEGACKYGRYNWRASGVRMSIYLDALHRHLAKLQDGEWADGDSLPRNEDGTSKGTEVPHLASIIMCAGIILDAMECGKLTDDRPPVNLIGGLDMETRVEHIAFLRKKFAEFTPHQHVITDATPQYAAPISKP